MEAVTLSINTMPDLLGRINALIPDLRRDAKRHDQEASFPHASMEKLREAGLLMVPFPAEFGGFGLHDKSGADAVFQLLHRLGYADLAIGRIFEAHINAIELIGRYGTTSQMEAAALAAQDGDLFALWVTDSPKDPLRLSADSTLLGGKWFCSAASAARRALVTAETDDGSQMILVDLTTPARVSDAGIELAGMRAATTGSVDFTGTAVRMPDLIGGCGNYLQEPAFSTGAWRSSAVALGGLAALIEATRDELSARGRSGHPFQKMRFGQAVIAHETGRLWLSEAAARVERTTGAGEDAVAYVHLARTSVERACLDAMELVQRSLGLSAFRRGNCVERIARDLATYLRQPATDEVLLEGAEHFMRQGLIVP